MTEFIYIIKRFDVDMSEARRGTVRRLADQPTAQDIFDFCGISGMPPAVGEWMSTYDYPDLSLRSPLRPVLNRILGRRIGELIPENYDARRGITLPIEYCYPHPSKVLPMPATIKSSVSRNPESPRYDTYVMNDFLKMFYAVDALPAYYTATISSYYGDELDYTELRFQFVREGFKKNLPERNLKYVQGKSMDLRKLDEDLFII